MVDRERRLSNTRPRDRLGRPLPWESPGFPQVPEREHISTLDALAAALDYLAQHLPFHAHEILEQRWRCCPQAERSWWQATAQAAAALTQDARGKSAGAQQLWARAGGTLRNPTTQRPAEITEKSSDELLRSLWNGHVPAELLGGADSALDH